MKKIITLAISSLLLLAVAACSSMHERNVASQPEQSYDWDKHMEKKFQKSSY